MNIVHMISGGDVGGAKTHVLTLLQGLNKTQNVKLVCFKKGDFSAEAEALGVPTEVVETGNVFAAARISLPISRFPGWDRLWRSAWRSVCWLR